MFLDEKGVFYYGSIKKWLAFGARFYYRKIKLNGYDKNVPKGKAVIFAPNHQCTLLDPLVLVVFGFREPAFLARADIFQNETSRKFLKGLRMLPIYRKKEATDFVERNKSIFDNCAYLLEHKKSFTIFVEGSHLGRRKLRPLKKGFARIAFQAAQEQNFEEDIYIVPVGINYQDFFKFRKNLLINYGEPINIKDYKELYINVKPEPALLKIKDELTNKLKSLMIDIESVEYYDAVDSLRNIAKQSVGEKLQLNPEDSLEEFQIEKKIIAALKGLETDDNSAMALLDTQVKDFNTQIADLDFRYNLFDESISNGKILLNFLLLIIFLPLHLCGLVSHYFIYKLPTILSKKKFKDIMFHSSVNMVGAQLLGTVFYPLQCLFVWLITGSFWWMLAYLISLPITGIVSAEWYRLYVKTKAQNRFLKFKKKNKEHFTELNNLREKITGQVLNLVK